MQFLKIVKKFSNFLNYFLINFFSLISCGPAAVSGGQSSPPLYAGGGDPLCIGKQEVGTYIYSCPYTVHEALCTFLLSFTAVNMVEGPANTLSWLKKPPAQPFAALHHPPWDYGIVFTYGPTPP
jgi:hypothetical protein